MHICTYHQQFIDNKKCSIRDTHIGKYLSRIYIYIYLDYIVAWRRKVSNRFVFKISWWYLLNNGNFSVPF